jgi:hypothetical protein
MNRKSLFALFFTLLLAGCLGSNTFDASNEDTIKSSAQKIAQSLPENQREEFGKAIMYFTIGGSRGFETMMGAAFTGGNAETLTETMFTVNIKAIDGLTGQEIIEKYRKSLAEEKAIKERESAERESVRELEKEAEAFLESNEFEQALSKYKAMNEYQLGMEASEAGIAKTKEAMESFTEKMNYMDKIKITEFIATRIDTYSDKNVPAVRISLKNVGDRSLDKIKVVVYFQDKAGNTIFEEDFLPVLVSEYSFTGNNKPLKPGYIREMEKGKYYTIDSQLSEWDEGNAFIKIADIKFSE